MVRFPSQLRHLLAGAAVATALSAAPAAAQSPPTGQPGWSFNLAPYLWVPGVDATLRYSLPPNAGNATRANVSVDAADLLDALKFGAMVAGEARNGRFTIITDVIYLNLGASDSQVKSVDFVDVGRNPVSTTLDAGTQSTLTGWLWTLAGGYTLASGDWGHVDATAGFRLFALDSRTDVSLGADVAGPRNGLTFARSQRLSDSVNLFDGIVGLRGRFQLGSGFSIPYGFDIGAGSSQLTWQAVGGLAYQTGWAGVTLGYRYLSYEQGGDKLLQDFSLGGPFLAVNFTF